jgi:hypothetical protein
LLTFLLEVVRENRGGAVDLPVEQHDLLQKTSRALATWSRSEDPERDFRYWDAVATAREAYRARVRLGVSGELKSIPSDDLRPIFEAFRTKVRVGIQRAVEMNGGASPGIPPTYLAYTVTDYDLIADADGTTRCDEYGRPYVRAKQFVPTILPLYLEGPVHALKTQPDVASARDLYRKIRESELYDHKLGMVKVNAPLAEQPHEIGRARAFTPGWLENESIWLHMEYKYLLEVLRAGLYQEFCEDLKRTLICFQDPQVYGRSPLENSSFLVSSAHPDRSLHGAGFVARLSGATAEFLSIWTIMMAGPRPFFVRDGKLQLAFNPTLPGWLFDDDGELTFTFLGRVPVTYHNPGRLDIYPNDGRNIRILVLHLPDGGQVEFADGMVDETHAQMVREGQITKIDVFLQAKQIQS